MRKPKARLNRPLPFKSTKGFSLLELLVTLGIASVAATIAVPNFTAMVQNNRIKSTTNHIIGSLQFARQTAAINKTQVTACSPIPSSPQSCALTNHWNSGIALLQGDIKVAPYTAPPPPQFNAQAPEPPAFVPVPPIKPEPTPPDRAIVVACEPGYARYPTWSPAQGFPCETWKGTSIPMTLECGSQYIVEGKYYVTTSSNPHNALHTVSWTEYRCSTRAPRSSRFPITAGYIDKRGTHSKKALETVQQIAKEYNSKFDYNAQQKDYKEKLAEYEQSKIDNRNAKDSNKALQKAYDKKLAIYNSALQKHNRDILKYNQELAAAPGFVVTQGETNTLLAHNPFAVTVTPKLQSGAPFIIYYHDKIKSGYGQIDIEDKRGRGEHSRIICVNMLGNLKVVKGNESCP